jgi:hypothetical protein
MAGAAPQKRKVKRRCQVDAMGEAPPSTQPLDTPRFNGLTTLASSRSILIEGAAASLHLLFHLLSMSMGVSEPVHIESADLPAAKSRYAFLYSLVRLFHFEQCRDTNLVSFRCIGDFETGFVQSPCRGEMRSG